MLLFAAGSVWVRRWHSPMPESNFMEASRVLLTKQRRRLPKEIWSMIRTPTAITTGIITTVIAAMSTAVSIIVRETDLLLLI